MVPVAERLLNFSLEAVTSWARLFLASAALLALLLVDPSGSLALAQLLLMAYLGFAATLVGIRKQQPLAESAALLIHGADLAVGFSLLVLTHGFESPFFIFLVFPVLASTLRWEWNGACATTCILAASLGLYGSWWLMREPAAAVQATDLARPLVWGSFLPVCGALLAYMAAERRRARDRFAKLGRWPRSFGDGDKVRALEGALAHAADVIQVPRTLVVWDEADEPHRHVLLWTRKGVQHSREAVEVFGELVGPTYINRAFVFSGHNRRRNSRNRAISRELLETFGIINAVSAPFQQTACRGRVFALDRNFVEEDLSLVSVIAERVGLELEERVLRDQLATAAAERERARLGRDLHDGVLQGLAAASMQLKVLSTQVEPDAAKHLETVRHVLADEAHRVRAFVEATRKTAPPVTGLVRLAPEISKRIERLQELWECEIASDVAPPNLTTSISTSRNIVHMVGEAVANAVRHGRATRVAVRVESRDDRIVLTVRDNGNGFEALNAPGSAAATNLTGGPKSLRSRVEDLGGTLYLSSSSSGTDITVELPA